MCCEKSRRLEFQTYVRRRLDIPLKNREFAVLQSYASFPAEQLY